MTRAPAEARLLNSGPERRLVLRRIAAVAAAIALGGLVALVLLELPHRWRALLFVPLWIAALAWLQAAAATSVRLASRGMRDTLDEGAEAIRDPDLIAALRRQARKLHVQALILGMLVTAVMLVLPL